MKKLIPTVFCLFFLSGCVSSPGPGEGEPLWDYSAAILHVRGMSCPLCSNNLDGRLTRLESIDRVHINLQTGAVTAYFNPTTAPTRSQIERAVKDAGFTLRGMELMP